MAVVLNWLISMARESIPYRRYIRTFRETRINDKVQLKVQLKNDIALRRFRETQP